MPLFAGCSKRELGEIATLADELSSPPGTTLIEVGRQGHEFFVLVEGEVDVRAKGRKLNTLADGSFFGEMALVSQRPRNATVTTSTPVRVLVVHETGVQTAAARLAADPAEGAADARRPRRRERRSLTCWSCPAPSG